MTLPQAIHAMRRAVEDLIFPPLSAAEKQKVWTYFDSACAYCGRKLERSSREGHIDHIEARRNGGVNNLGNCVLACRECNGDEKRDNPWEAFLKLKCPDNSTFTLRRGKIISWQSQPATKKPKALSEDALLAKRRVEVVIRTFQKEFRELRAKI